MALRTRSCPFPLPILLALLVTLAALAAGCGGGEGQAAGAPGGPQSAMHPGGGRPDVPVAVDRVRTGTASSYYTTTATLEAESHAEIASRTTGVVREILREEGDLVPAGATLLVLEDDEAKLRVQQAEANYDLALADYDRRAAMKESGLLSDGDYETTKSNLKVRESELGLARVALSHTRIEAPFEGRVVRRLVDLGANVTPGTPLFEMMDVTPLLVRVHIPAKRMGVVAEGQSMEVRLDSTGEVLTGVVSLVSPIVDATTGTVKVTAEIHDYPEETRPGDFAEVKIVTARHENAMLVPSLAVFEEQGENVLYVAEDGKAVRRVVEPGFVDGNDTEIESGLEPGELVIVKGQRQLRPDGGIEILEGPPDVLAEAARQKEAREAASASEGDAAPDAS